MKKKLTTAIVIAACAALCAAVWPQSSAGGITPADADNGDLSACMDERSQPTVAEIIPLSDDTPVILTQSAQRLNPSRKQQKKKKQWPRP